MLIDTHCHLNFKVFRSRIEEVLERARQVGVEQVVVVGSHLKNSRLAVRQAQAYPGVWAAVGIHPHHVWDYLVKAQAQSKMTGESLQEILDQVLEQVSEELSELVRQDRVVAVGETGIDRHFYDQTQYENKQVTDSYIKWQKAFFKLHLEMAAAANKAVIIHQREAVGDLLDFFVDNPYLIQEGKTVFHCCEPEEKLLIFAKQHQFLIGVDGDVTYDEKKADFIKQVPLEMLVLETDSPFLTPEPDRSEFKQQRRELPYKNRVCEPRHIVVIAEKVAQLKAVGVEEVTRITSENAHQIFSLS